MRSASAKARRSLMWLAVILIGIYGLITYGVTSDKTERTPGLALDLAGGRMLILAPVTEGGEQVTQGDLEQAVEIIRRRIDATGVAEAAISTQGQNIVVELPGNPDQSTIDMVQQAAQLQFRPVISAASDTASLMGTQPVQTDPDAPSVVPQTSPSETPAVEPSAAASPEPSASPAPSATPTPTPTNTANPENAENPSSFEYVTDEVLAQYDALNCLDVTNLSGREMGDSTLGYAACHVEGYEKYILGPVELFGSDLKNATSGPRYSSVGTLTGDYEVRLFFSSEGGSKFDKVTQRLLTLENPRNRFAMVLDGAVISAPTVQVRISDGEAQITGNFTQEQAKTLANQLKFGALPMTLELMNNDQISATLGAESLRQSLIFGMIGLALVVIYSLFQYRALALVTIGSLITAALLNYGVIVLLSWLMDFRLSLAGIAGLIVAIGITADSFIVYFERIRDELREGRSLSAAIEHGWARARRTIIISDIISLLAAVVLYFLAVGGVRGFAFTLGLTTLIDLVVVMMFTHPVVVKLAKTKFFGDGHPWSGLDPRKLGRSAIYKGRGRVSDGRTLAERKAEAVNGGAE